MLHINHSIVLFTIYIRESLAYSNYICMEPPTITYYNNQIDIIHRNMQMSCYLKIKSSGQTLQIPAVQFKWPIKVIG